MIKYFNIQISDKILNVRNNQHTSIIYSCSYFFKKNNMMILTATIKAIVSYSRRFCLFGGV